MNLHQPPLLHPADTASPVAGAGGVLADVLAQFHVAAAGVHDLLNPLAAAAEQAREWLTDTGQIHDLPEVGTVPPRTIAAVDGARVVEQMYAADLLIAVGCAADGLTPHPDHAGERHTSWVQVMRHEPDTARLCDAAMIAQEVGVLARLPHQLRVYDGSHTTLFVAVLTALFSRSDVIAAAAADLCEQFAVPDALTRVTTYDPDSWVVGLPKSDSADDYVRAVGKQLGVRMEAGDRFLASQVLRPGQLLAPQPVRGLAHPHMGSGRPDAPRPARQAITDMQGVIEQIAAVAQQGRFQSVLFRPRTSDTVLKVEFSAPAGADPQQVLDRAMQVCALLDAETVGPHMLEPYCQWAVDRVAKTISPAASAIRQQITAAATGTGYAALLARSYRT